MSQGGEIWKKAQTEAEELRNLKKLKKGSSGERIMDAFRNKVFKHYNVRERKQAPEKLEN